MPGFLMKHKEPLKAIGYWREPEFPEGERLPEPQDMVDPHWRPDERVLIGSYLRTGKVAQQWKGFAVCRLCAPSTGLGSCDLTDGEWVWPEGLEHYVEEHGLFLPDEFIDSMRRHKWMVLISLKEVRQDQRRYDFSDWITWAAAIKTSRL